MVETLRLSLIALVCVSTSRSLILISAAIKLVLSTRSSKSSVDSNKKRQNQTKKDC